MITFRVNFLSAVAIVFTAFSMISCGDIQQELRLNKDGSGSLETTMDIGELLSMAQGFQDLGSDQDTFSDDMAPDTVITQTEPGKDAMTLLMEKITDPAHDKDFDTIMSFLSIMPDSVRQKETRPDLMEKMFVRLKSPANSADLSFGVLMNFNSAAELREMIQHMDTFDKSAGMMSETSPVGMDSETFLVFDTDMKAGWIRVDTVDYGSFATQMGMTQDSVMSGEEMGMIEMMFGNSKIKTVIHVPGEVISCTNPDAILTKDNKVMLEYSMLDVMRKGKMDGYAILFKP